MRSIVIGTSGLSLAAVIAIGLTLGRGSIRATESESWQMTRLAGICVLLQAAHFGEEYLTRFYERFPQLLGLAPWSAGFFVAFNVCWLLVWTAAATRIQPPSRAVTFALWFLAVVMVGNGLAHPALAVRAGGYFPGLVTAPVVGLAGVVLWLRLIAVTRRGHGKAVTLNPRGNAE